MEKILITGGSGVLGSYVKNVLNGYEVIAVGKDKLDVSNYQNVNSFFNKINPQIVIHLAALTNVDECQNNPKKAFEINSEGTKYISTACREKRIKCIYVSTASVFAGRAKEYFEDDIPDPVHIYGKSKLKGEQYVQEILDDYLILRIGWLIGGGKREKKFISHILDKIKKGDDVMAVNDKYGTLSYAKEVADVIRNLLNEGRQGIFHFGSKGECSRYDIALKLVELSGSNARIIPTSSSYFELTFFSPRPEREVIGSRKIPFLNTWEESLSHYYFEIAKDK